MVNKNRRGRGDDKQLDRVRWAVTNAVLHAYRDREGESARAGWAHGAPAVAGDGGREELWILVLAAACGFQAPDVSPGHEPRSSLISDACDRLTVIRRGRGGTELQIRFDFDADYRHLKYSIEEGARSRSCGRRRLTRSLERIVAWAAPSSQPAGGWLFGRLHHRFSVVHGRAARGGRVDDREPSRTRAA